MKNRYLILGQIGVFIGIFLLWEVLVNIGLLDEFLFSKPSSIAKLLINYLEKNQLFEHIAISLVETILGIIIGSILGFLIAVFLWYFPIINRLLTPLLVVLNALPKTALAPIFIIWVGTNMKGIVFVSISIMLVMCVMALLNFFNNTNQNLVRMLESFGAKRFQIFYYIVFPANVLNIISTIKINVGMCFIGVIVGEFMVSKGGLGYLIMYGTQVFRLDLVMMSVVVLAVVSILLNYSVSLLEKYFIKRKEKVK